MKFDADKGIVIAAHRGNQALFRENTMEAFRSAAELGVDMIETDIHCSSDGELVLIHDHEADRTTDGKGLIREMSFARVRELNAGTAEIFSHVPTLAELLEFAATVKGLLLDLEIKVYLAGEGADRVAYTVDKTVSLCEKYGMDKRIMFNSFDAYVLEYIREKFGRRFIVHGYYPLDIMKNVSADPLEYLDYACYWAEGDKAREYSEFLISRGIAPCTGSNTSEEAFFEAAGLGCAMFTENAPANALGWRNRL